MNAKARITVGRADLLINLDKRQNYTLMDATTRNEAHIVSYWLGTRRDFNKQETDNILTGKHRIGLLELRKVLIKWKVKIK